MEVYGLILIGLAVSVACFILYDTDALEAYAKVLFKSDHPINNPTGPSTNMTLLERLQFKYPDSFWVDLVNCSVCLTVWLVAILSLIVGIFNPLIWAASIFIAWSGYFILKILQHHGSKD